jgi:transcriptional regulator with XRE-family HTH domain
MGNNISEADIRAMLGSNLRRLRNKQKLSQLQLGIKAELTHNFINDIVHGKKWLSPKTLATLSRALKTEPREFFSPEAKIPKQEAAILAERLNDLSGDVQKMAEIVADIKDRYLQDSAGEG